MNLIGPVSFSIFFPVLKKTVSHILVVDFKSCHHLIIMDAVFYLPLAIIIKRQSLYSDACSKIKFLLSLERAQERLFEIQIYTKPYNPGSGGCFYFLNCIFFVMKIKHLR